MGFVPGLEAPRSWFSEVRLLDCRTVRTGLKLVLRLFVCRLKDSLRDEGRRGVVGTKRNSGFSVQSVEEPHLLVGAALTVVVLAVVVVGVVLVGVEAVVDGVVEGVVGVVRIVVVVVEVVVGNLNAFVLLPLLNKLRGLKV
jgi:hypothetical protein